MKQYDLAAYRKTIRATDPYVYGGKISKVIGLTVEAMGLSAKMGDFCRIYGHAQNRCVLSEVVGFKEENVLLMPFSDLAGVGREDYVICANRPLMVPVGTGLIGRVIDAFGEPMDGRGPVQADGYYPVENQPPNPLSRQRIADQLPLGIKAIDALLSVGKGQRLGIFAGSGVGKSTLLGMIARNAKADVNVIILVGERGREVREFLEKDLGEAGLARSVLVVATSDQPALVRLKSAMVGMSIAEYFRDQGCNVLLLVDSLTRFATAQREIGMAVGEPPVSRGYTPSVFSIMPKLLERSGNSEKGSITGLYTVLVDGDDMNEPVSDVVRGILDGHIVLSRKLANSNHYPAIDILASISRVMPDIVPADQTQKAGFIKKVMATYREAQDLVSIGAYKAGSNPDIDEALKLIGPINDMLTQRVSDTFTLEQTRELVNGIYAQRRVQ
jgi:flagellum-specific ATP synthase